MYMYHSSGPVYLVARCTCTYMYLHIYIFTNVLSLCVFVLLQPGIRMQVETFWDEKFSGVNDPLYLIWSGAGES